MTRKMTISQQKTKKRTNKGLRRAAALGLAMALGMTAVPLAPRAVAQQRGPVRRTVEGKVKAKDETPIKGAVVYLKDARTLAVKSFISDEDGQFHFGQLSQNTDYEIYAEYEGKRSKVKKISSFDSKNDFLFTLIIEG